MAPQAVDDPTVVLLTPGMYNSAYFEHAFLAQQMGIELVEGQDLFVQDNAVFMRTTQGPRRVDVIYRRIDDDFIDPLAFRPDSTLGVPGLLSVLSRRPRDARQCDRHRRRRRQVDLSVRAGHDPRSTWARSRSSPTCRPTSAATPRTWRTRWRNMTDLVVKEVHGAGGYGMLVGPAATQQEIADFRRARHGQSRNYIAQPTLALSTCPTYVEAGIAPRHIDLRPFVLSGKDVTHGARRPDAASRCAKARWW